MSENELQQHKDKLEKELKLRGLYSMFNINDLTYEIDGNEVVFRLGGLLVRV